MFSHAVGREGHCKQMSLACVGSARSVSATLGLPPLTAGVLSRSTLLRLQVALQGAGPGFRALLRSELLRLRFSGTPQRRRLGWACILCASQVRAAQALGECSHPRCGLISSYHVPVSATQFPGWQRVHPAQVCRVSSGELSSGCDPPDGCQPSRTPGRIC